MAPSGMPKHTQWAQGRCKLPLAISTAIIGRTLPSSVRVKIASTSCLESERDVSPTASLLPWGYAPLDLPLATSMETDSMILRQRIPSETISHFFMVQQQPTSPMIEQSVASVDLRESPLPISTVIANWI